MRNILYSYKKKIIEKLPFFSKFLNNKVLGILLIPLALLFLFVNNFLEPIFSYIMECFLLLGEKETKHNILYKYILIPTAILSIILYCVGLFIFGYMYLETVISGFNYIIGIPGLIFFLLLPQVALFSFPIIILFTEGNLFIGLIVSLLVIVLYGLQIYLINPKEHKLRYLSFLNDSPWIYLCGAISTYMIGYYLIRPVGGISNHSFVIWVLAYLGLFLIILSFISAIIWSTRKKHLYFTNKNTFYRPSWLILVSTYFLIKSANPDAIPSAVPSLDIVIIFIFLKRIAIFMVHKIRKESY